MVARNYLETDPNIVYPRVDDNEVGTGIIGMELESIADKVSVKDEFIAINGDGNPQQIYLSHRKGWTIISNEQAFDISFINTIKHKGCKYLFINNHALPSRLEYEIIYEDLNFTVYKL